MPYTLLEIAVVIAGAIVLAALVFAWNLSPRERPPKPAASTKYQSLVVTKAECFPGREDTATFVTVVGVVENPTAVAFTNAYFYVRFFDASDELIDAVSPRDYGLVVPANGSARFKVVDRWLTHGLSDYARCEVDLTWAKPLD